MFFLTGVVTCVEVKDFGWIQVSLSMLFPPFLSQPDLDALLPVHSKIKIAEPRLKNMLGTVWVIAVDCVEDVSISIPSPLLPQDNVSLREAGNAAFKRGDLHVAKRLYGQAADVVSLSNLAQVELKLHNYRG
jgi:hypothetical protein